MVTLLSNFDAKKDPMASFLRQCQNHLVSASFCDSGQCVRKRNIKQKPSYRSIDIMFKFPRSLNLMSLEGRNKVLCLKSGTTRAPEDQGRSLLTKQARQSRMEKEKVKENEKKNDGICISPSASDMGKGKFKVWEDVPEVDAPDLPTLPHDSSDLSEPPLPSIPSYSKGKKKQDQKQKQPNNFRRRVEAEFERKRAAAEPDDHEAMFNHALAPDIESLGVTISEEDSARQLARLLRVLNSNTLYDDGSCVFGSRVVDNLENVAESVDMMTRVPSSYLPHMSAPIWDSSLGLFPDTGTYDEYDNYHNTGLDDIWEDIMLTRYGGDGFQTQIITRQQRRETARTVMSVETSSSDRPPISNPRLTRPSPYKPQRVCVFNVPDLSEFPKLREWGIYLAGMLFASGWWFFFDAAIISKHTKPDNPLEDVPVRIGFVDYVPAILSTLGMIIVSLINKAQISRENDEPDAWRARCWLFVGFALLAGGLAGSVSLLILKYVVPEYPSHFVAYGIAAVVQNVAIMLSTILTWVIVPGTYESAGRLVQTDLQQIDETHFTFSLSKPEELNHVVIFLTGQVAFPDGIGATVHFLFPGYEKGWQLLGKVSNEKPSAIFRLRGSAIPSKLSSNTLNTVNNNNTQAIIGISVEPINQVDSQTMALTPANTVASKSNESQEVAKRMLENLFDFLSGFAHVGPETLIPLSTLQQWYNKVLTKLQNGGSI
ncbi:hypothetical protein E3P96_00471 [Wallemia ichthyophaga]|nr:hypothetical protein E3P96_00471 [Wallemia ichthyophaga]